MVKCGHYLSSAITSGWLRPQVVYSSRVVTLVEEYDWEGLWAKLCNCSWWVGSKTILPDWMVAQSGIHVWALQDSGCLL